MSIWSRNEVSAGIKKDAADKADDQSMEALQGGRKAVFEFPEDQEHFGPLLPYVVNKDITDVDWNGKDLWLTSVTNERIRVDIKDQDEFYLFMRRFAQKVSNLNQTQFNKLSPVLEAETENLRISILHDSRAITGMSCCIRHTPPMNRITTAQAIETNYCSEKLLHLLVNCIQAHMNIVVCGEPKAGKTELAKYLSMYIPNEERVCTIEDVLEWHYPELKPDADCVQIKIDEDFNYTDAIKASLKQNPRWLCITETRGNEVRELVKGFSTGVSGMTTLHTDDVTKVPQRMVNMVEDNIDTQRFENNVYEFIDVAILVTININPQGQRYRQISQVGFFVKDDKAHTNFCRVVYSDGHFVFDTLPDKVLAKFHAGKVNDPFYNAIIAEEAKELQQLEPVPQRDASSASPDISLVEGFEGDRPERAMGMETKPQTRRRRGPMAAARPPQEREGANERGITEEQENAAEELRSMALGAFD